MASAAEVAQGSAIAHVVAKVLDCAVLCVGMRDVGAIVADEVRALVVASKELKVDLVF